MRYRLRFLSKEYDVGPTGLTLGRDPRSDIVLDDAMVSRSHARVVADSRGIRVEDLGSRNGLYLNGRRAAAVEVMRVGDVLTIGKQALTLLEAGPVQTTTDRSLRHTLPQIDVADLFAESDVEPSIKTSALGSLLGPEDATSIRRLELLRLLGEVAEKSVALGRPADAERVLSHVLEEVRAGLARGKTTDPELVHHAARRALFLAAACEKGIWVRYVLDVYMGAATVPPGDVADGIASLWSRFGVGQEAALGQLIDALSAPDRVQGPAERFTLGRLQALRSRSAHP